MLLHDEWPGRQEKNDGLVIILYAIEVESRSRKGHERTHDVSQVAETHCELHDVKFVDQSMLIEPAEM
jgi:hypothetical protein